jgi:hypothetical protein
MKTSPLPKLRCTFFVAALLGLATTFQSCKMDDPGPVPDISALTIINASPNSSGLDFYIENERVNPSPFTFPLRMPYQRVYSGTRPAKVTASGNSATLFSGNLTLLPGEYSSLFIIGKVEALDFLLIKDDLSFPVAGKTKIRFGNLSPDAAPMSLEIVGDTTQFSNKSYKAFTAFKNISPGKFTLNLKDNATNAVLATMANVEFLPDKVYTVWAKGLATTTVEAQKLGIHVINHDN